MMICDFLQAVKFEAFRIPGPWTVVAENETMGIRQPARGNVYGVICIALLFLFLDLVPTLAAAQEVDPRDSQTLTLYFENDIFFGTDYLYTNGVKLSWTSPDLDHFQAKSALGSWANSFIGWLPFANNPGFRRTLSLALGQNMYTPEDTEAKALLPDDRPYAGLTYISAGFSGKSLSQINTWEIMLGMVGRHSYAEDVQKTIHQWKGVDIPQGWDNQIGDEPILNVFFEQRRKIFQCNIDHGWAYDIIPSLGAGLGNLFIGAHAGAQIRFGWNLPNDFGTSLIRPGSDTNAPLDEQDPRFFEPFKRLGAHLFMGVDGEYVLRNLTLDGNTFGESTVWTRNPCGHLCGGGRVHHLPFQDHSHAGVSNKRV